MHTINYEALLTMFMGKTDKVNQLIIALQARIPEWQQELSQAVSPIDYDEVRKVCHRIRGAAGTITAERAAYLATTLGDAVKKNEFDKVDSLAAELQQSLTDIENFNPPTK